MFGQRLRLARKRAGLSMQALSDAMTPKVSAQAISKYESNKMLPSSAVLVGLGKVLNVSLDFLMSGQAELFDEVEFRKHSTASVRDRAQAESMLIDSLERYLAIEHVLDLPCNLSSIESHRTEDVENEIQIDEEADRLRCKWKLGTDPIPSMCELLEENGIKVITADLPQKINGLSCRVLRDNKSIAEAVLISNRVSVERRRFTLAQKLAHRILHVSDASALPVESAMDRFAGAFLVPTKRLLFEVGGKRQRLTYYEIVNLKHRYGVSASMLLVRLEQAGVLSSESIKRAFSSYARKWRKFEPDPIAENHGFAEFDKPRRFEQLVLRAVGEQLTSPIRAAQLLNCSLAEIEEKISGPLR